MCTLVFPHKIHVNWTNFNWLLLDINPIKYTLQKEVKEVAYIDPVLSFKETCTLSRKTNLFKLVCLPYVQESTLKGKTWNKYYLRVNHWLKGLVRRIVNRQLQKLLPL